MRRFFVLMLFALAACTSSPAPAPAPPTSTEYVRTPADCAKLTITPLTVEPGLQYIHGTHAEWLPKGQFIRIRIAITNPDTTFHTTRSTDYQLVDTADAAHPVSNDGMAIKRQPTDIDIGAGNRLEMDLWYDIPVDTGSRMLRDTACNTTISLPG